jgi:hypothetical protein
MARSAGGQPVRTFALPQKTTNLYAFVFPLRPGETQFQVLFHMPYKAAVTINPRPVYAVDHLVVILPKKMQFTAAPGAEFQAMTDPRQSGANLQVASNTRVGQPLTFTLSGTGTLAETKAENVGPMPSADAHKSTTTVQDSRAAAGAVLPATASEHSQQFRRYILWGLAVLLAIGTISIVGRSTKRRLRNGIRFKSQPTVVVSRKTSEPADASKLVLNDLKERLFRLEVEHKQNRISQPEYEKAIAELHQNLDRAIARKATLVS